MRAIRLTACLALGLASLAMSGVRAAEKVVLGSVAQRVLSHAHLPVFVVRD